MLGLLIYLQDFDPKQTVFRYAPMARRTPTDDSTNFYRQKIFHGTCAASKAAGRINGVSKNTFIHVMKTTLRFSDLLWAFDRILTDMVDSPTTRVVVLFPATSITPLTPTMIQIWTILRSFISDLTHRGAIIVIPAGNNAKRSLNVDTFPALFTVDRRDPLPLIVVGAVDDYGARAPFSQTGRLVTVWAPGVDVQCAGRPKGASGTAFAAGMVSHKSIWKRLHN